MLYTEAEMPPAYQDWRGDLQGVHSPSYNISANGSEPFDALALYVLFRGEQCIVILDLHGDMLHPIRSIGIKLHIRVFRQFATRPASASRRIQISKRPRYNIRPGIMVNIRKQQPHQYDLIDHSQCFEQGMVSRFSAP